MDRKECGYYDPPNRRNAIDKKRSLASVSLGSSLVNEAKPVIVSSELLLHHQSLQQPHCDYQGFASTPSITKTEYDVLQVSHHTHQQEPDQDQDQDRESEVDSDAAESSSSSSSSPTSSICSLTWDDDDNPHSNTDHTLQPHTEKVSRGSSKEGFHTEDRDTGIELMRCTTNIYQSSSSSSPNSSPSSSTHSSPHWVGAALPVELEQEGVQVKEGGWKSKYSSLWCALDEDGIGEGSASASRSRSRSRGREGSSISKSVRKRKAGEDDDRGEGEDRGEREDRGEGDEQKRNLISGLERGLGVDVGGGSGEVRTVLGSDRDSDPRPKKKLRS